MVHRMFRTKRDLAEMARQGLSLLVGVALLAACSSTTTEQRADGGATKDSRSAPDTQSAVGTRTLCEQYVKCVAETNPGGLKLIADQYGASGSCFDSLSDELCRKACLTGLRQNNTAFPNARDCPACLSDAECESPSAPGCDTNKGRCVACLVDGHCAGSRPACDLASQSCVECTADKHCTSSSEPACDRSQFRCTRCLNDSHCSAPTPACEPSSGRCLECTQDSHCSGTNPACDTANYKCCATPSCGALKASIGTKRWICGILLTQCGQKDCGGCSVGTCKDNECQTTDQPCTPGASSGCAIGEICGWDSWHKDYRCVYDERGEACDALIKKCGNAFTCTNSGCQQLCKTTADCLTGTCKLYQGYAFGECA